MPSSYFPLMAFFLALQASAWYRYFLPLFASSTMTIPTWVQGEADQARTRAESNRPVPQNSTRSPVSHFFIKSPKLVARRMPSGNRGHKKSSLCRIQANKKQQNPSRMAAVSIASVVGCGRI